MIETKYSRDDFEASKFLGNAVGRDHPFLREIACMSLDGRKLYSYLEVLELIMPDMTPQEKRDLKLLKKIIQRMGEAEFNMDIVSHLSMKAKAYEKEENWE